jgi:[ribosomal protein S18]-alanine N-acetyltransferase
MDCQVRPALPGECAELAALHGRAFEKGWSAKELAAFLADASCGCLAAETAGTLTGLVIVRAAADEAEILTLAIDAPGRRQGTGRRLMEAAHGWAAARGAVTLFLEVGEHNVPARALYHNLGYVAVGHRRDYYVSNFGYTENALVLQFEIGP